MYIKLKCSTSSTWRRCSHHWRSHPWWHSCTSSHWRHSCNTILSISTTFLSENSTICCFYLKNIILSNVHDHFKQIYLASFLLAVRPSLVVSFVEERWLHGQLVPYLEFRQKSSVSSKKSQIKNDALASAKTFLFQRSTRLCKNKQIIVKKQKFLKLNLI